MNEDFKLLVADMKDIEELYQLQLLAFESEAEMIGSRKIPALQESKEAYRSDFMNWCVLKLINRSSKIIGAIRYREVNNKIEIGRVMIHPNYRKQGLAQYLLREIDQNYPNKNKELYTCAKSWINIALYQKMGYIPYQELAGDDGLIYVYFHKASL